MPDADAMIALYGDQAYHRAVEFVVIATHLNDVPGQSHYAGVAHELMRRRYHKHEKREATT